VYVNIEGDRAHAVNTSWAMLTLIYAGQVRSIRLIQLWHEYDVYQTNMIYLLAYQIERDPTPLHRAAKELINMQMDTGEFPQQVSSLLICDNTIMKNY
jgi:hypothetical protein